MVIDAKCQWQRIALNHHVTSFQR